MNLNDLDLSTILKEEETVRALYEGSISARAVLVVKLLPSLQTLTMTSFRESIFSDYTPPLGKTSLPPSETMLRHLTFLQVKPLSYSFTFQLLIRCMALPSLQFITI
jgi:hypothetical protein